MEMGREGHSGLYTMHFSNLFPPPQGTSEDSSAASKEKREGSEQQANTSSSIAGASSEPPCSLTQFTQWHVLIRMNVENDVCFVKGDAKIFSPTPSLASPMARGIHPNGEPSASVTTPDAIPVVPIPQRDRRCSVLIEGTYRVGEDGKGVDSRDRDGAASFRLEVRFDKLEAELLGLREPVMLEDVTFTCGGYKGCGWHLGTVSVTAGGKPVALPRPLRFLLKSFFGKRCTYCLDPVYAIGYTCDDCETTQYCSRECLQAHMRGGHGLLCPLLKKRYPYRSGYVATEVNDDTGLVAWWRCLDNGEYTILVDANNALHYAMEFFLCSLRSAKDDGLRYRLIWPTGASDAAGAPASGSHDLTSEDAAATAAAPSPPVPTDEEVVDFTCVLLREVNRSAILDGCAALSSACLNYLYCFSPSTEITIQSHVLFFSSFDCSGLEGPLTTVEEYVSYSRPLHALATLQIEYALRSPISAEFWRRIKFARDVAMALVKVNEAKPCAGLAEMVDVVAEQLCESLTLLAKVFLIMATRAPADEAQRRLMQAEKMLRQAREARPRAADPAGYAQRVFRYAALLLLFNDEQHNREAAALRAEGTAALAEVEKRKKAAAVASGEAAPAQQQSGAETAEMVNTAVEEGQTRKK